MNLNTVDKNLIKIEARNYNPYEPKPPKKSIFGSLLRGLGALAAPIGFAATPFFPPAAVIGFAGLGAQSLGAHRQAKVASQNQTSGPGFQPVMYYPGVQPGMSGAAGLPAGYEQDVLNIVTNKQNMINDMTQAVK